MAAQVEPEALPIFERIAHGRKGLAMAEAREGLCTVCHVRLRPQIFNEVRRNDGIIQCDSCTRILYFVPVARQPTGCRSAPERTRAPSMIPRTSTVAPAAIRARLATASTSKLPDGTLIEELFGALGIATNNVAEYNGLLAALEVGGGPRPQEVQIRADSELLVKQMRGEYKVKHPGLQPLAARARLLVAQLDDVTFQHVRREQNKEADRLSNLGMDEAEAALRKAPTSRTGAPGRSAAAQLRSADLCYVSRHPDRSPTIRPAPDPFAR